MDPILHILVSHYTATGDDCYSPQIKSFILLGISIFRLVHSATPKNSLPTVTCVHAQNKSCSTLVDSIRSPYPWFVVIGPPVPHPSQLQCPSKILRIMYSKPCAWLPALYLLHNMQDQIQTQLPCTSYACCSAHKSSLVQLCRRFSH